MFADLCRKKRDEGHAGLAYDVRENRQRAPRIPILAWVASDAWRGRQILGAGNPR
jgi:hypothetical protein